MTASTLPGPTLTRSGSSRGTAALIGTTPTRVTLTWPTIGPDSQLLAADPGSLQRLKNVLRHSFGQVDRAEVRINLDRSDELAFNARLVGYRADDVPGCDAVIATNLDSVPDHAGFGRPDATTFIGLPRASLAFSG